MKVLAIDPGEARIGLAVSDPTGTVARPLTVLGHTSRHDDVDAILAAARDHNAELLIVGLPLDSEGNVGHRARRALRLVEALRSRGSLPVTTWDESGTTVAAQRGSAPDPMLDARAAAFLLQDYLDAQARA